MNKNTEKVTREQKLHVLRRNNNGQEMRYFLVSWCDSCPVFVPLCGHNHNWNLCRHCGFYYYAQVPSVLWCCWLGGRKGIQLGKKLIDGMLAWLSVWGELQICICPSWCHCHSLSLAPVYPDLFLPAHPGNPGQRAVKRVLFMLLLSLQLIVLWFLCW